MIEIISVVYGEDKEFGAGWNCRFKVNGFDISRVLFINEAKTEQDAINWLNAHYEELLDQALETYGAEMKSKDLLRRIAEAKVEADDLKVRIEQLETRSI